jgi:predicted ATP-grasp superfamily ATP-dependent carboligase
MAENPQRDVLLQTLANLDQQMADAAALMVELKEGSPDYEAASEWLAETTAASARVSKLLAKATDDESKLSI